MDRELARKRPAQVIEARPAPADVRRKTYREMVAAVDQLHSQGWIEADYRVGRDPRSGEWIGMVTFRPRRASWLRRNALKLTATFLILISLFALLAMLVQVIVPVMVIVGAVTLALAVVKVRGNRQVDVVQRVRIRG